MRSCPSTAHVISSADNLTTKIDEFKSTPIDIHCSKLVDWLVQRRHCRKDWGENLASIRRKIRAALRDMPENEEIKQLLIGSKLDYFQSKKIVDILKTTEADSKNFFGYYSSQRMKDWQDIVNSYERDYIYIAELATDLIRETNYEIPAIRKTIARLNREKDDAEKERNNLLRKAQQLNSEHQKLAQLYEIPGNNVVQEFAEKSRTLHDVMNDIVSLSRTGLDKDLEYYCEYSSATSKLDSTMFLPMLRFVINSGNTTVYEWKYGEAPENIEVVEEASSSGGASNPPNIDTLDDEIDFGEDLPSSESSSGFVHVDKSDNGNVSGEETFINIEESGTKASDLSNKTARGDDAFLVLEFRKSRHQFFNNLYELEAFYTQLLNDIQNSGDRSDSFLADSELKSSQKLTESQINQALKRIRQITNIANQDRIKILFQMKDSTFFVESLREKFDAKLNQAADCRTRASDLSELVRDLEVQIRETEIHLKKCISASKEIQGKVEGSLRDLYKGRPVNIMGCVG